MMSVTNDNGTGPEEPEPWENRVREEETTGDKKASEDGDLSEENEDIETDSSRVQNDDEEKEDEKFKRGRGRPSKIESTLRGDIKKLNTKMSTLQTDYTNMKSEKDIAVTKLTTANQTISQLNTQLAQAQTKVKSLTDEKDSLTGQLSDAKFKLDEKCTELDELLGKMDESSRLSDTDESEILPEILFILDDSKQKLKENLPDIKAAWHCTADFQTIKDLHSAVKTDDTLCSLIRYDKIIIMLGTMDIVSSSQINKVTRMLNDICEILSAHVKLAIVQIPPINMPGCRSDPTIFNYRLNKLKGDEIQIIEAKEISQMLRNDIVKSDGYTLTDLAAGKYRDYIAQQLLIPEATKKTDSQPEHTPVMKQSNDMDNNVKITEFMEVDNEFFGLIIGKDGTSIKKLNKAYKTHIQFGLFKEQKKVGKEKKEIEIDRDGILITGNRMGNRDVKTEISKIIKEAKVDKENEEGPKPKKSKT